MLNAVPATGPSGIVLEHLGSTHVEGPSSAAQVAGGEVHPGALGSAHSGDDRRRQQVGQASHRRHQPTAFHLGPLGHHRPMELPESLLGRHRGAGRLQPRRREGVAADRLVLAGAHDEADVQRLHRCVSLVVVGERAHHCTGHEERVDGPVEHLRGRLRRIERNAQRLEVPVPRPLRPQRRPASDRTWIASGGLGAKLLHLPHDALREVERTPWISAPHGDLARRPATDTELAAPYVSERAHRG